MMPTSSLYFSQSDTSSCNLSLFISDKLLLSIVVPAYNEEKVLEEFQRRLQKVIDNSTFSVEIIYVNDGSTDDTLEILK